MSDLVKDKIVVVTGGAGLLGKTFCQEIANNGGVAVVAEYDIAIAQKLCTSLQNDNIVPAQINITDKDSIIALINNISQKYGKIDALVNSAYPRNKNYGKHFFEVTYDDFCENIGFFTFFVVMSSFMTDRRTAALVATITKSKSSFISCIELR